MSENVRRPFGRLVWLYVFIGLLFLVVLAILAFRFFRVTPIGETSVEIPQVGPARVQFTAWPYPPRVNAPIRLTIEVVDEQGERVDLGPAIPYQYGLEGQDTPIDSGEARLDDRGVAYEDLAIFPDVGDYWLEIELVEGTQVRFKLTVREVG
jgi:hypothetical protein